MRKLYLLLLILVIIPFLATIVNAANYTASFNLNKKEVQLGDEFTFSGEIFENNKLIEDQINAVIYFKNENVSKEVFVSILNGDFSINTKFKNTPAGSYTISVTLRDLDGNILQEFENIDILTIEDRIDLVTELNKDVLPPGEILKLKGTIRRALDGQPVPRARLKITIDDLIISTDATDGEFEYTFSISPAIKSNYHDIVIEVEDDFGNKGSDSEKIFIEPRPTTLQISIDKDLYLPSEKVRITPTLLDQAKDSMLENIEIKIYNSKNKRVLKTIAETNKVLDFELDKYAVPGFWRISAKYRNLEAEYKFEVPLIKQIKTELKQDNVLRIENIGNVKYDDLLEIIVYFNNQEQHIKKRTNIDPGEFFEIDLKKEIDKGTHTIKIPNTDQTLQINIEESRSFSQRLADGLVSLTGQVVQKPGSSPSNTPTYSFIAMLVVIILLVVYRIKISNRRPSYKFKDNKKPKFSWLFGKLFTKSKKKSEIKELKEKILSGAESHKGFPGDQPPIPPTKNKEQKNLRVNFDEPFKFK